MTDLAASAAFELQSREKHYPRLMAATRGADAAGITSDFPPGFDFRADLLHWRRIAEWTATGQFAIDPKGDPWEPRKVWTPLAEAAERALRRREAACAKHPADAGLAKRRAAVAAIAGMLASNAIAFEGAEQAT